MKRATFTEKRQVARIYRAAKWGRKLEVTQQFISDNYPCIQASPGTISGWANKY